MENVLVAIILIFLLLFGGLTMSSALISAQQTVMDAQQETDARSNQIAQTALVPVQMRILNAGSVIEVTIRNNGEQKLADFDRWDVFTEYYDLTPVYRAARLPYDGTASFNDEWSIGGLFIDGQEAAPEAYEPGILNPGEDLLLHLKLSHAVGVGQSAQVSVATNNGIVISIMGKRSAPPILTLNTGTKIALHGRTPITADMLLAQDDDSSANDLIYTVTTAPTQGTLSPETQFTQQQIDDGKVVYTHTGSDVDNFGFTVSDGTDTIGAFNFPITINQPPHLATNSGLTLPTGETATITRDLLKTTDADDPPEKLTYTVTQFPANGLLSLGSTFTQADIDGNRLTYTHGGGAADLFKFVVSDGYDVIGTYTFTIQLVN